MEEEVEAEEEEEEASDTGRVGCSWCIKRPPGYTYIYVCVRARARGTAACVGRSADISDTVRARFSPFRSLSLPLSYSSSPVYLSLSPSLFLARTLSRRAGERKKGKTKVRAKRNAGSLTARRRRRAMAACPVLLVHSVRVTGATTTRTTTTPTATATTTTVRTLPAAIVTATTTTARTTGTTSTTEVVPAAARRPLDVER